MTEVVILRDRRFAVAAVFLLGCLGAVGCAQTGAVDTAVSITDSPTRIPPWEWWRDLGSISSVPAGDRVIMQSSHCPTGCEYDRHSPDDPRFIRTNKKGEGVIFSAEGTGAVTRIWMVMGEGLSEALDPSIRLRVRIDGRRRPVVDLPLPEVFAGETPPFLSPLVADATGSGGGHVSYVPIAFSDGCEISLVGADEAKIWFQVTARLTDDAWSVRSYTGDEELGGFRSMLGRAGSDPWQDPSPPTESGSVVLAPGGIQVIATLEGPDMINGLIIRVHERHWSRLGLRLTFDDHKPQLIPLLDLFGVTATDGGMMRSLLVGVDTEKDLYCYFPMPFFQRATVELLRRPVEGPAKFKIEYAIRTAGSPPPDDAGAFGVQVRRYRPNAPGSDMSILDLDGSGSWVGLVVDLSPVSGKRWDFLEGDERVFIGGEDSASWQGTGVEDFFNGGFYFRDPTGKPTGFGTALAGAPYIRHQGPRVVMYRLLLGDAGVFEDGIRAAIEPGPTGETSIRAKTVAYYYAARRPNEGDSAPTVE